MIKIPSVVQVNANSEEEAKHIVEQNLIDSGQIKPNSPIEMEILMDVKIDTNIDTNEEKTNGND